MYNHYHYVILCIYIYTSYRFMLAKNTFVCLNLFFGGGFQTLNPMYIWVAVSNMFLFSPLSLGKWSNLTSIFSDGLKPPTRYSIYVKDGFHPFTGFLHLNRNEPLELKRQQLWTNNTWIHGKNLGNKMCIQRKCLNLKTFGAKVLFWESLPKHFLTTRIIQTHLKCGSSWCIIFWGGVQFTPSQFGRRYFRMILEKPFISRLF